MTTTFTCPHCRRESDYEDIQMDADLIAIIKLQPVFGKHHDLVWAYCELFGIVPLKTKCKKLRLLLDEMKSLFQAEEFAYQKKRYPISQAGIAEALNIAAKKNFAEHLESHNYLKKIMISISEREGKSAGIEAEKSLRKKEEGLMSGRRDTYPVPEEHVLPAGTQLHYVPKSIPPLHLTEEQIAENKRRTRELLKSIGG